jgi:hypothetical protein
MKFCSYAVGVVLKLSFTKPFATVTSRKPSAIILKMPVIPATYCDSFAGKTSNLLKKFEDGRIPISVSSRLSASEDIRSAHVRQRANGEREEVRVGELYGQGVTESKDSPPTCLRICDVIIEALKWEATIAVS